MTTIGFIGSGQIGATVARLAISVGYDVVMSNSRDAGPLADSWRIERDAPGYGPNLTAKEMTAKLAEAVRGVNANPVWSP
jgi:predicted dinucleotide-binding enzyme